MLFRTLPPGVAQKLINGHEDVLTAAAKSRAESVEGSTCPRCSSPLQSRLHPTQLFAPNDPLPRIVGVCPQCNYTIDPKTGLVLDAGNWKNVPADET